MVHVTGFVIGEHLSQYPIEFDSIQEEIGPGVRLLSTQELYDCGRIEGARMGRSRVLKNQMSKDECAISWKERDKRQQTGR